MLTTWYGNQGYTKFCGARSTELLRRERTDGLAGSYWVRKARVHAKSFSQVQSPVRTEPQARALSVRKVEAYFACDVINRMTSLATPAFRKVA